MPFVTDLHTLISTATSWITGLAVSAGALMLGYHALMRNFTHDPSEVAGHGQAMRKILIGTIIVGGASAIAHTLGGFFGL